ncbi:MAG: ABC transporter ATP-binding protein [Thermoleophilia bacterium]|nr:ABC transporter ATP-binding protein [Thermoleophilia bacterium]
MSVLRLEAVSRWYGDVVAVNDVSMEIGPGITGLLGPNGAGKSTLIHMMGGFLKPSSGVVTLDGRDVFDNVEIYRQVGIVPEREEMYDSISGWKFVLANAQLHGLADPAASARRAIEIVDMIDAQQRDIRTYSKGMRQRIKLATAIVHEPRVLLLDEPFNGLDPRQRLHMMELLRGMAADGCSVLFSSHILEEVEQLATSIEVLVAGRHAASGDFRAIRGLMTQRPHQYVVRSSDDRALAASLMNDPGVGGVQLETVALDDEQLRVEVTDVASFARTLPQAARAAGIDLREVRPADESLESVFAYLVAR